MLNRLAIIMLGCLLTASSYGSFLPPNNLHLHDSILDTNMTQEEFNTIIQKADDIYSPIISAQGGNLVINRNWTSSTVNASASQSWWGNTWSVNMYGGLARRPEVTPDGFALVVCHELGHHLAGYPFTGSTSWAANEGQSDYFATLTCAREIWRDELEVNAGFRDTISAFPKKLCDDVWTADDDQNLCYRTMEAGKSLADLLSALGGSTVSYTTPDISVVSRTDNAHPEGQCRLDTYMAGAICAAGWDADLIPGKRLGFDRNSASAEEISADYTCSRAATGFDIGYRPQCWFKSKL